MPRLTKPPAKDQTAPPPAKGGLAEIATLIVAEAIVRVGQRVVQRSVERSLLNGKPARVGRVVRGRTIRETVAGTVLAAVARRSVPGAVLVGGGLIVKALRDRRRARIAARSSAPRD